MITIFSIPKAFEGHIGIIQRNAIISWLKLKNHPEIILFGNESGTEEICKEFNLKFIPDVKVNEYGTPLCNDMFKRAQEEIIEECEKLNVPYHMIRPLDLGISDELVQLTL